MNVHAKFDLPMEGSQNFKSRSRDPFLTPLTQFCISFVSTAGDESAYQI